MRSAGIATAAATPVLASHSIGMEASALALRRLMLMFRLGEESTTGSTMP